MNVTDHGDTFPDGGFGYKNENGAEYNRLVSTLHLPRGEGLTPDDGQVRYENASGGVTFTIQKSGGGTRQIQCVEECFGRPDEEGHDVHFCGVPKVIANRLDHPVCFP